MKLQLAHPIYIQGDPVSAEVYLDTAITEHCYLQLVATCDASYTFIQEEHTKGDHKLLYRAVTTIKELTSETAPLAFPVCYFLPMATPASSHFNHPIRLTRFGVVHQLTARLVRGCSDLITVGQTCWDLKDPPGLEILGSASVPVTVVEKSGLQPQLEENTWYCSYDITHPLFGKGTFVTSVKKDYAPVKAGEKFFVKIALQNNAYMTVTKVELSLIHILKFPKQGGEDAATIATWTQDVHLKGRRRRSASTYVVFEEALDGDLAPTSHVLEEATCQYVFKVRFRYCLKWSMQYRWTSGDISIPALVWPKFVDEGLLQKETLSSRKKLASILLKPGSRIICFEIDQETVDAAKVLAGSPPGQKRPVATTQVTSDREISRLPLCRFSVDPTDPTDIPPRSEFEPLVGASWANDSYEEDDNDDLSDEKLPDPVSKFSSPLVLKSAMIEVSTDQSPIVPATTQETDQMELLEGIPEPEM